MILQSRARWILEQVSELSDEIVRISDEVVVVLALPELSGAIHEFVGLSCRKAFPTVENV